METTQLPRPGRASQNLPQRILTTGPAIVILILFTANVLEYFRQGDARNMVLIKFNILAAFHLFWSRLAGH
ncbi:hypothetical protein BGZ61DRAFT_456624 [Ilyonectria robusta]|uniref:uncharacterized protein n=1 Tax=Ilyonectria robusta TaxID=1079257 RepID=UPI001E8DAAA8|nr:uncharacterized protein BGZ61DRAFT_456624 [Ilyonectria robusta]KAH8680375.1 hypothetical protein BGZ61DRAFT_456624 [Ilyonectria robusta]